jgi:tartrate dehydrogenase/decarboxylase/D-malate dehydrogenase
MKHYQIAVIPGDGVGIEVMDVGLKVLDALAARDSSFACDYVTYSWSCEHYLKHGEMMPVNGMNELEGADAILLGAVGYPGVPDHISLRDLLLRIRQGFDQYVNYRPIRLLDPRDCPIKGKTPADIDMVFVRENTEGEYAGVGGRIRRGTPEESAIQTAVFTRRTTERLMRYSFELARARANGTRPPRLTSVTKSNALNYSMVFWDELFAELSGEYPDVVTDQYHVDAMAMYMVQRPEDFDVIVASNLFGDILTDLGAVLQGGLGFASGGNINPERRFPSMFEPVHGSAPPLAGKNVANPIAMVWTIALMLHHLGHEDASARALAAIERVVTGDRARLTPDMGGSGSTTGVGALLVDALAE